MIWLDCPLFFSLLMTSTKMTMATLLLSPCSIHITDQCYVLITCRVFPSLLLLMDNEGFIKARQYLLFTCCVPDFVSKVTLQQTSIHSIDLYWVPILFQKQFYVGNSVVNTIPTLLLYLCYSGSEDLKSLFLQPSLILVCSILKNRKTAAESGAS